MSAPGIEAAAPMPSKVQSTPVGRCPASRPRRPRSRPRGSYRLRAPAPRRPTGSARQPQRAEDEPDQAADRPRSRHPQHRPEIRRLARPGAPPRRGRGRIDPEDEELDPMRSGARSPASARPHRRRRSLPRSRRQHPGGEAPVDPARPDVGDRCRSGGDPGHRDVCSRGGRRIGPDEQQHREPDVPKDEPQKAPGEGDEEAPHADSCEGEGLH
jgi:hypothetical protein